MLTVQNVRDLLADKHPDQYVSFVLARMKSGRKIVYPLLCVEEEPDNNVVQFILADKDKDRDSHREFNKAV